MIRLLQLIVIALLGSGVVLGAEYFPTMKNFKREIHQDVPMGPLGGVARLTWDESTAEIVDLMKRGPLDRAKVEVGDLVTRISGKRPKKADKSNETGGEGFPEDLGEAILEASEKKGIVVLEIKKADSGELVEVEVEIKERPNFSDGFPDADDELSALLSKSALEALLEQQQGDGDFPSNDYSDAWAGLALLASDESKGLRAARKLAKVLSEKYELRSSENDRETLITSQESNWMVCQVGIFLAEYYFASGDQKVLRAVQNCSDRMKERLSRTDGRFGHGGIDLPYEGKGLVIINTHAHLLWALAARAGLQVEEEAWKSSEKALDVSMTRDGAIGYNFSAVSGYQAGARTGSWSLALNLGNLRKGDQRKMGRWLGDHYQEFPDAHAMASIGILYGSFGLKAQSRRDWEKAMKDWKWMFALCSPVDLDDGAYYIGQKGNIGGDEYLKLRVVANFMAVLMLNSHRDDTLWILGNREEKWGGS